MALVKAATQTLDKKIEKTCIERQFITESAPETQLQRQRLAFLHRTDYMI